MNECHRLKSPTKKKLEQPLVTDATRQPLNHLVHMVLMPLLNKMLSLVTDVSYMWIKIQIYHIAI